MSRWKNSLKRRNWQNNRRKKYMQEILKIKLSIGKCQRCGWDDMPEILQFHHKSKEEKKFKFSVGNLGNHKWEKVLEEINKCELICPNCHYIEHYKEKDWFKIKSSKAGKITAEKLRLEKQCGVQVNPAAS